MSLYKILLVDDEEEVRTGIMRKILWEELGFQVAGDAENGEDALEKIGLLEPDMVMTDIKMPYMDGLTLAQRIRQQRMDIEIVMFSGFDEFEYAKQAIRLNVMEYILKPVNVEELTAILKKLKLKLDKKMADKRDVDLLRLNYQRMMPVLKEHFFTDLIHGKMELGEIEEGLEAYAPELRGMNRWVAASVQIEIPRSTSREDLATLHREKELIPISVQQILSENLEHHYAYSFFRTSMGICIICGLGKEDMPSGLVEVLNAVCKECTRVLEVSVTIGVGEPCAELERIQSSYLESREAMGYRASIGGSIAICIGDVEMVQREYLQFDERSEGALLNALKFGTKEGILQTVESLIGKMEYSKAHLRERQVYIISIINTIMEFAQKYNLYTKAVFQNNNDYLEFLSEFNNMENAGNRLTEICLAINCGMNEERNDAEKNIIRDAKDYIIENFPKPELSVEMLCTHLHISQAYFSTVFKKETGQSYVNYLTELRLNKAIELLNKTEDKTYVIASKVGYTEPNYFSYVFKKKFGVSPSKYRGK